MTIIDVIKKTINNREISNDAMGRLLNSREKLNQWIEYVCYDEISNDERVKNLKNKIYSFYSNNINDLINKYEVYFHDFSTKISIMIMDLVKMISMASSKKTVEEQIACLDNAYDIAYCLYYALCLEIIGYCIERVDGYKKVLKRFNYKSIDYKRSNVVGENNPENLIKEKKKNRKELRHTLKNLEDNFSTLFNKKEKHFTYKITDIGRSISNKETNVEKLGENVDSSERYLSEIEEFFPKIINNGYNPSLIRKLMHFILFWGLPIFCGIMSIVIWCG